MKKLLIYVTTFILVISCNTNKHFSASPVGLVDLENYAAKSNIDLPDSFNYLVITNQSDFDATFGITKSGNINITYPGFSRQTVVACIAQPTTKEISVHFYKAEVTGKVLKVYCSVAKSGEQLKAATIPVAVATVPTVLGIKRIVFYTNGEMVMTKAVDFNDQQMNNATAKDIPDNTKPVVLKRTMRRPAVI